MNLEILREQLIQIINNCQLPPGCAYYVLKDVLHEVEKIYSKDIQAMMSNPDNFQDQVLSEEDVTDKFIDIQEEEKEEE